MRVIARAAVAVLFGYALVAPVHGAATLTFTTIDVPGALLTNAQGVNHQGDVVGGFNDAAGLQHGFLRSGSQFRTINFPGASTTRATSTPATSSAVISGPGKPAVCSRLC